MQTASCPHIPYCQMLLLSWLQQCVSFLLLCNKLPQMWWLKIIHNLWSHSLCESGFQLSPLFMVWKDCEILAGLCSHWRLEWGRIFQAHSGCWQNSFLCSHMTNGTGLLLTLSWRPHSASKGHLQFLEGRRTFPTLPLYQARKERLRISMLEDSLV